MRTWTSIADAYAGYGHPQQLATLAIPGQVTPEEMAVRLERVRWADLLVVVTPDGATDFDVSAEIGAAVALGKPVFGFGPMNNQTWRGFVQRVEDVGGIVSVMAT